MIDSWVDSFLHYYGKQCRFNVTKYKSFNATYDRDKRSNRSDIAGESSRRHPLTQPSSTDQAGRLSTPSADRAVLLSTSASRKFQSTNPTWHTWVQKAYVDCSQIRHRRGHGGRLEVLPVAWPRTQMESTNLLGVTIGGETYDSMDAADRLSVVNGSFDHPPYRA